MTINLNRLYLEYIQTRENIISYVTQSVGSNIDQFIRESSRDSVRSSITGQNQSLGDVLQGGSLGSLGIDGVSVTPVEDIVMSSGNIFSQPSPLTIAPQPTPENQVITNEEILQQTDFETNNKKHEIILISDFKPFYNPPLVGIDGRPLALGSSTYLETYTKECFDDALEHRRAKAIKLLSSLNDVNQNALEEKRLNNLSVAKFFHSKFVDLFNLTNGIEDLKEKLNPSLVDINCVDLYQQLFLSLDERSISENVQDEILKSRDLLSYLIELSSNDGITAVTGGFKFSNTKIQTLLRAMLIDLITTKPFENKTPLQNLRFLISLEYDSVGGIINKWFSQRKLFLTENRDIDNQNNFFNNEFSNLYPEGGFRSFLSQQSATQISGTLFKAGFSSPNGSDEIVDINNVGSLSIFLSREISISMKGSVDNKNYTPVNGSYNPLFFIQQHMTGSLQNSIENSVLNTIDNVFVRNTLFGVIKSLGPLITPTGTEANVSAVTYHHFDDTDLSVENNVIKSSYRDLLKSRGIRTTISSYSSLLDKDISILNDLKDIGYIPVYDPNKKYSEIFTSNKFFRNIYYRFFDEKHEPKFIMNNSFSQILGLLSFTEPVAGFKEAYKHDGSNYKFHFKYFTFYLIWNICSQQNEKIDEISGNLKLLWVLGLITSSTNSETFQFNYESQQDLGTDYFSNPSETFSSGENKELFNIIVSTMNEFYQIITQHCLADDGTTVFRKFLPKELMLLLYEMILSITVPSIRKVITATDTSGNVGFLNIQDSALYEFNEVHSQSLAEQKERLRADESMLVALNFAKNKKLSELSSLSLRDLYDLDKIQNEISNIQSEIDRVKATIEQTKRRISVLEGFLTPDPSRPRGRYLNTATRSRNFSSIDSQTLKIDALTRDTFFYLYGFDKNLNVEFERLKTLSENSSQFVESISEVVTDPIYLQKIMSKDHLSTSIVKLNEMISVFQNKSVFLNGQPNVGFLNSSLMGDRTRETFLGYMKSQIETTGIDFKRTRLVSIGIPSGFRISSFAGGSRQFDALPIIVQETKRYLKIGVGIINLFHPEIVFQKQYFTYDLDKFVIRNDEGVIISNSIPLGAIPTTNVETDNFIPSFIRPGASTKERETHDNLVRSYFLELYVRSLTSISLSEDSIFERRFFDSRQFFKDKIRNIIPQNLISLGGSTTLDSNPTAFSSYEKIALNMVFPKRFDRVFNMLIDQQLFKVDTVNTPGSVLAQSVQYGPLEKISGNYFPKKTFPLFDYCVLYSTLEFEVD